MQQLYSVIRNHLKISRIFSTKRLFHQRDLIKSLNFCQRHGRRTVSLERSSHLSDTYATRNGVHAIPARVISTSFALACFAATLCLGLYHGNAWTSILASAILVSFVALIIGSLIGSLLLRSVDEHIAQYQQQHPIPDEDAFDPSDLSPSRDHQANPS